MRRKDREITEPARIDEIIRSCDCCRLGLLDGESAYVVPLNFGYVATGDARAFYFHCAREGKKLDLLRQNPNVGFELDTHHALLPGEMACDYAFRFQSVIGKGVATLVEDRGEKKAALNAVMCHHSGRDGWAFTDAQADSVAVIRLNVTEMACKEHL